MVSVVLICHVLLLILEKTVNKIGGEMVLIAYKSHTGITKEAAEIIQRP